MAIASQVPVPTLAIGAFSFQQWANTTGDKELYLLVVAIENRSPFASDALHYNSVEHLECEVLGRASVGFCWAVSLPALPISFLSDACWDAAKLAVTIHELDDESGAISTRVVDVEHLSRPEHCDTHQALIDARGVIGPCSGKELWKRRRELFPSLRFLDRCEAQITSLPGDTPAFHSIASRLEELNTAVGAWDPAFQPSPQWLSKVTPEGERRKNLCRFRDGAGDELFDLHARFTPGAGRIHFRIRERSLVIAHIGEKL